ncbi:beta-ketoacyl-[acyl-carrier-protein] synthase family protein [bacterium]|nr:MAG: beta-ketoacyl-[acyl-carrier-protein] synthase family protein [bacterium]
MKKRVVITGIGVVSPIGTGKEKFWKALVNGKNGVRKAEKIDTSRYRTHMAAEVKDFNPNEYVDLDKLNYPSIATLYAIASCKMALDDSKFDVKSCNNVGIVLGANTQDPLVHAEAIKFWRYNKYSRIPSKIYRNLGANLHAVRISEYFKIKGHSTVIPAACAAGNTTIAYAFDAVRSEQAIAMLAGSSDPINHLAYGGFDKMKAMSSDLCRPFDKDRKGMIIGEGAGFILLEDMQNALKRKAHIYAEMLGYGLATDAYNVAIPHPEGIGAIEATNIALKMSNISPGDIDYVNAHGTATIANDRMESKLIKRVFKDKGNDVFVSSIKSMVGHCMGAASAIEACASSLIVERNVIPPNINYNVFDPECDVNVVKNKAIEKKVNFMISNSFAFGGNNAVIVISKFRNPND